MIDSDDSYKGRRSRQIARAVDVVAGGGGKGLIKHAAANVIVGEPNPLAAAVHDRMPVILNPEDYDSWLDTNTPVDELRALLRPYPAERMQAQAVSRAVNSVKNDNEECIQPIGEPALQAKVGGA